MLWYFPFMILATALCPFLLFIPDFRHKIGSQFHEAFHPSHHVKDSWGKHSHHHHHHDRACEEVVSEEAKEIIELQEFFNRHGQNMVTDTQKHQEELALFTTIDALMPPEYTHREKRSVIEIKPSPTASNLKRRGVPLEQDESPRDFNAPNEALTATTPECTRHEAPNPEPTTNCTALRHDYDEEDIATTTIDPHVITTLETLVMNRPTSIETNVNPEDVPIDEDIVDSSIDVSDISDDAFDSSDIRKEVPKNCLRSICPDPSQIYRVDPAQCRKNPACRRAQWCAEKLECQHRPKRCRLWCNKR